MMDLMKVKLFGLEQGVEQGHTEEKLEIAKKMLNENIEIKLIEKVTGLTKEEIDKLRNV